MYFRMYPKNFAAFKVLTKGLFAKIYAPLFAIAVIQLGLSWCKYFSK